MRRSARSHKYATENWGQTDGKLTTDGTEDLPATPHVLGCGKRLFADGAIPAAFKVTESTETSKGVIIVNYERAGAVLTGSL